MDEFSPAASDAYIALVTLHVLNEPEGRALLACWARRDQLQSGELDRVVALAVAHVRSLERAAWLRTAAESAQHVSWPPTESGPPAPAPETEND